MARMYPPEVSETVQSSAESQLFDRIRTGLADDWIVLHSLGLGEHRTKLWAEVDFVLIGPPGVFCLEVKGGRVFREDGCWYFQDGKGNISEPKKEGPYEQAKTAAYALKDYLKDTLPWGYSIPVNWAVAMPHIEFHQEGPDIEPKITYDLRDEGKAFSSYIRRLSSHWLEQLEAKFNRPVQLLTGEETEKILDVLRGDFDYRPSLKTRIGLAEDELLKLTKNQYRVLDEIAENPRVLIKGGAGSGKTWLAVEEARRRAGRGDRVFLCCHTEPLALHLKQAVKDCKGVDAHALPGFMVAAVEEAKLSDQLPPAAQEELLEVFYPRLCVDALIVLDRLAPYDVLIIDEAQDLMRDAYIEVFDALLRSGMESGQWKFFMDPYQNVFEGIDPKQLEKLLRAEPSRHTLSVNCRNTAPIASRIQLISGLHWKETLHGSGPDVFQEWAKDEHEQRLQVSAYINELLNEGIKPQDIIVLSRRRREESWLRSGLIKVPFPLKETVGRLKGDGNSIRFSTVRDFKGLESDVVLVVDIDDLDERDALLSFYVGASRAKTLLALFLDEKARDGYDRRVYEYGEQLEVSYASSTLLKSL